MQFLSAKSFHLRAALGASLVLCSEPFPVSAG